MPWARFDERFPGHRRIRKLSDSAFRLHVSAVCWSCEYLTDGHVSPTDIEEVSEVRRPEQAAAELVRSGRWHTPGHDCPSESCWDIEDGWLIHDFLDYNPSRQEVEEKRAADAERKRKGRQSESRKRPSGVRSESKRSPTGRQAESEQRPSVPTPVVTNVTTSTRPEPSSEVVTTSQPTAQTLLGEWIDHCDPSPPSRVKGQIAKLVGEMLDEGQPYEVVRRGLAAWNEKDQHPSTLPSFVFNASRPTANKATVRTAQNLALVQRLQEQERGA